MKGEVHVCSEEAIKIPHRRAFASILCSHLVGVLLCQDGLCLQVPGVGIWPPQERDIIRVDDHKAPGRVGAEAVVAGPICGWRYVKHFMELGPGQVVQAVVADHVVYAPAFQKVKCINHTLQHLL